MTNVPIAYNEIVMTEKLRQAMSAVAELPEDQQDVIASLVIEELQDESRWAELFANSQDVLERLAAEAEHEDEAERIQSGQQG